MNLREGVQVLKLWDTIGPKWPQIVLLQVSKKEYEMFLKDPKDYVNDLKVLGDSSTHKVTMCQRAAVKPDGPANTTYLLILKHERDTTTVASSSSNVEF